MSKIISIEKFRKARTEGPLVAHESLIREIIRDINITIEPALTAGERHVTLLWQTRKGSLTVTFSPATLKGVVSASTHDESILMENVEVRIDGNNRWIGYLFDDNFH